MSASLTLGPDILSLVRQRTESGQPMTLREMASRLGCTQKTLLEHLNDDERFCVNTALGIPGAGYRELRQGDYQIEWLEAEEEPAERPVVSHDDFVQRYCRRAEESVDDDEDDVLFADDDPGVTHL